MNTTPPQITPEQHVWAMVYTAYIANCESTTDASLAANVAVTLFNNRFPAQPEPAQSRQQIYYAAFESALNLGFMADGAREQASKALREFEAGLKEIESQPEPAQPQPQRPFKVGDKVVSKKLGKGEVVRVLFGGRVTFPLLVDFGDKEYHFTSEGWFSDIPSLIHDIRHADEPQPE